MFCFCLIVLSFLVPSLPDSDMTRSLESSSLPPSFDSAIPTPMSPLPVLIRLGNSTIDSSKSFRVPQATDSEPEILRTDITTKFLSTTILPTTKAIVFQPLKKHNHFDRKFGPSFEDSGNATRITVQLGDTADLNCRISLLQDKTVSWVKRRKGRPPELLTVGTATYAANKRVSLAKRYPGNWRLQILQVQLDDEGIYECQISTHPPRTISIHLHVNSPSVWIVDEGDSPLSEVYYKTDSNLVLVCRARNVETPASLVWMHENVTLNEDVSRGGISVRTEQIPKGANSTLRLAHVNASDAGNYTCAVRGAPHGAVTVHVLNEESLAELHAGGAKAVHIAAITVPIAYTFILVIQYEHLNLLIGCIALITCSLGVIL